MRNRWISTSEAFLYINWQPNIGYSTDKSFLTAGFLRFDVDFVEGGIFVRAFDDYLGVGEVGGGGVLAAISNEDLVGGDGSDSVFWGLGVVGDGGGEEGLGEEESQWEIIEDLHEV